MKAEKVYYYSDELNDEFSGITRDTITVDENFTYIHKNPLWRLGAFIVYRIIMTPVAMLYMKFKFSMKVVGKEKLKTVKGGYFMYGNHTNVPSDGYIPSCITFPKRDYVVVNADNLSLKGTKTFMQMVGALPLPTTIRGMKTFVKSLGERVNTGNSVVIYPEAHIWPYYTGIRPFRDDSFGFPVMFKKPAFAFTITYHKKKRSHKPSITVYIDGPFYYDETKKSKEAQKKLRDDIYNAMVERSKLSDYCYVKYIKKGEAEHE